MPCLNLRPAVFTAGLVPQPPDGRKTVPDPELTGDQLLAYTLAGVHALASGRSLPSGRPSEEELTELLIEFWADPEMDGEAPGRRGARLRVTRDDPAAPEAR